MAGRTGLAVWDAESAKGRLPHWPERVLEIAREHLIELLVGRRVHELLELAVRLAAKDSLHLLLLRRRVESGQAGDRPWRAHEAADQP